MTVYSGSCHCGAVAFKLDGEVNTAIECNCSYCRRRGSLLAFFPASAFTLETAAKDLGTYHFNKNVIAHHFCPKCGVGPFSIGLDPESKEKMVAVNVRCLPGVNLAQIKIAPYDGASH